MQLACFRWVPIPQLSSRSSPFQSIQKFSVTLSAVPLTSHLHLAHAERMASFVIRLVQPYIYALPTPPSTPPASPALPFPDLVAFIENIMARSRGSFATLLVARIYLHRLRSQLRYYRPAGMQSPSLRPSISLLIHCSIYSRRTNNSPSSILRGLYRWSVYPTYKHSLAHQRPHSPQVYQRFLHGQQALGRGFQYLRQKRHSRYGGSISQNHPLPPRRLRGRSLRMWPSTPRT